MSAILENSCPIPLRFLSILCREDDHDMDTPRRWMTLLSLALVGGVARGQVALSVDRLDPTDPGGPAPPGLVVVDLFADVATTDAWTASGLKATTANGA